MVNKIRSILLIDDDRDDYELVEEALHEIDPDICVYYLHRCEDAPELLKKDIDLILLDINMPHHDGFSWLNGLRKHGHNHPVVMYSNSLSPANIIKAYNEGACLYFAKPESFSGLVNGFKKLINLNWSDALAIKNAYQVNGEYLTFRY